MLSIFQLPFCFKTRSVLFVALIVQLFTACKKEAPLEVSDADINYFVRTDNPADPVDHALYQFYMQTGIAGFYNDTIHKKLISRPGEKIERFDYTRLAFIYTLQGEAATGYKYLTNKAAIPELLTFIQSQVLPTLPADRIIPSLFFIDSFYTFSNPLEKKTVHGWTSIYGLNTLGVIVQDVALMSELEKKTYRASLLAGIAEKWMLQKHSPVLQKDFYQVTRDLLKTVNTSANYVFIPYELLVPANKIPQPEAMGLLYHPLVFFSNTSKLGMPTESIDLRAFLTATFLYTQDEFLEKYAGYPAVVKKYRVLRDLLLSAGYKLQ
ncbi:MAG: hypothetical protein ACTHMC_00865 [Pseudobacter sp.]|uniref:hypothetical protein n=1 Tax=Pseudobacter sp. TaxID=2045420 RepID=UPI003F7F2D11